MSQADLLDFHKVANIFEGRCIGRKQVWTGWSAHGGMQMGARMAAGRVPGGEKGGEADSRHSILYKVLVSLSLSEH